MEPTQGQRLQAAMSLAGIEGTALLAKRLNRPGMSKGTLDRITRDLRQIKDYEAAWLAEVTNVPAGFFLDERPIPEATNTQGALAEVLAAITSQLAAQTQVLDDVRVVLERVEALLGKDTETAETIAEATRRVDEASRTLLARSVGEAGAGLRGGTRRRKPAAPKRATKRTPGASPQDPPAGQ